MIFNHTPNVYICTSICMYKYVGLSADVHSAVCILAGTADSRKLDYGEWQLLRARATKKR